MKKNLLLLLINLSLISLAANAQWCIPTTVLPYDPDMPGITHVVINTIDRTSLDCENYPNNSYVNTGMSTDLTQGITYDISITFTIDGSVCPDMNLRVWVDLNQDGQLDDAGETLLSANNQSPGTYMGSITIPTSAKPGITRMRITAKMTPTGGHTLPTPCDNPPDPFGYHGEIEDYDVNIVDPLGVIAPSFDNNFVISNSSSGVVNFSFETKPNSNSSIIITDLEGKIIKEILPQQNISAGNYSYSFNSKESRVASGIYFVVFTTGDQRKIKRIVLE